MTYDHWKTMSPDDQALFDAPPEIEVACDMCGGAGQFEVPYTLSKWTDDPYGCTVEPCSNCEGRGFFICEAEGDTPRDLANLAPPTGEIK